MDDSVVTTVKNVVNIGQRQHDTFVKERLKERTKPINDPIAKNHLPLFREPPAKIRTKDTEKLISLKSDCALFSHLYIACQTREGNLDEFFRHENQP